MHRVALLLSGLLLLLAVPAPAAAQFVDQPTQVTVTIEPFEGPLGPEPVTRQVKVEITRFGPTTLIEKPYEMKIRVDAAPTWVVANVSPPQLFFHRTIPMGQTVRYEGYVNLTVFATPDAPANLAEAIRLVATTPAAVMVMAGSGTAETPVTAASSESMNASSTETVTPEDAKFVSAVDPALGVTLSAALALAGRAMARRRSR